MSTRDRREGASFLGRLARSGRVAQGAADDPRAPALRDAAVELSNIKRNLRFLLNTRKTHGSVLADYGLGDYDDPARRKDAVDHLGDEIQATVARHEPRLGDPRVVAVARDRERRILFDLTGTVAGEERVIRVAFDTVFRGVTVEE
ncbi:type VI secretion system baseplate subunit TssE [Sorangium sp. So ce321]|uniref:type VI secretion system baseplate subunit TssE n=1 Tax=Sorangium sp. So ce321 TaxID=3133300 RepID=UPI003F606335